MHPERRTVPGAGGSRWAAAGLLFCAAALSGARGAPADDKVTVLDPVFVEASPISGTNAIPWQYFAVPGFEIISRCPNSFNESYADALQEATAARLALLPREFWGELATPIKIVIYNRPPEPREGFISLNPIDLTWSSEDSAIIGSDAVQLSHPVTLGDGDTFINCGNYWDIQPGLGDFSVDVDSAILIQTRAPRFPGWFAAGLVGPCGIYTHRAIRSALQGEVMVLPNAVWTTTADTEAIQEEARKRREDGKRPHVPDLLPLGALFGGARSDQGDLWNAEAALLVRWGLFGGGQRRAFLDFVDQSTREPATEELLKKCLGLGYSELRQRLADYLPGAASNSITVPFSVPRHEPLEIRDATSAEVARIVGDWGRLEGRAAGPLQYSYRRECLDQADLLFERRLARKEKDPLFLAAFGLYALQVTDNARAREALEAAAAAGVVRPRAYVELARLKLQEALPSVGEGIGDLNQAEFGEIRGLLMTARAQMPSFVSTYFLLARVLERAPSKPTLEELWPLGESLHLFPQNADLAYKVATLYRRSGFGDQAAAIISRARGFAESDKDRALLDTLSEAKAR